MSQVLEIKRTPDGKVLARRKDGQPLTPEDREAAKKLAEDISQACWNCGATMTEDRDISGAPVCACWACAKWA